MENGVLAATNLIDISCGWFYVADANIAAASSGRTWRRLVSWLHRLGFWGAAVVVWTAAIAGTYALIATTDAADQIQLYSPHRQIVRWPPYAPYVFTATAASAVANSYWQTTAGGVAMKAHKEDTPDCPLAVVVDQGRCSARRDPRPSNWHRQATDQVAAMTTTTAAGNVVVVRISKTSILPIHQLNAPSRCCLLHSWLSAYSPIPDGKTDIP